MLAACVLVLAASRVGAHSLVVPDGLTATAVVEVSIECEEIRVEIMATVPDLIPFSDVFPNEFRIRMGLESESDDIRHHRFFSEGLAILADGRPLTGRVASFGTRELEGRDALTGASMPLRMGAESIVIPVVVVDLRYELGGRPETLTLKPPNAWDGGISSSISVVTTHLGLPVTDLHPFTGVEVFDLDWDDPWHSACRSSNLRRRDDSPFNVFLYIEPTEVRVEILARPVDLQSATDLGVDGLEVIGLDLQDAVRSGGAELLAGGFELRVDGEPVTPVLEDINFLERRLRCSPAVAPPVDLPVGAAVLGAVFTFPVAGYPGEVALTWELFPETVEVITAAVVDVTGSKAVGLNPDHRALNWENTLQDPWSPTLVDVPAPATPGSSLLMWVSWLVLAATVVWLLRAGPRAAGGAGSWRLAAVAALTVAVLAVGAWIATRSVLVNENRASEIIGALLHNVYHAFDFSDEQVARSILEESVTGAVVERCLEIGGWLDVRACGDQRAGVRRVELTELKMSRAEDAIEARCEWVVTAAVGHFGHRHLEFNRVAADLRVEPVGGAWRITALDPLR